MVGAAGFEPTLAESESDVLPLNYAPEKSQLLYMLYFVFQLNIFCMCGFIPNKKTCNILFDVLRLLLVEKGERL